MIEVPKGSTLTVSFVRDELKVRYNEKTEILPLRWRPVSLKIAGESDIAIAEGRVQTIHFFVDEPAVCVENDIVSCVKVSK